MLRDAIPWLPAALLLGLLGVWNYLDEPSRELWQGHPEKYRCVYYGECHDGGSDGGRIGTRRCQ